MFPRFQPTHAFSFHQSDSSDEPQLIVFAIAPDGALCTEHLDATVTPWSLVDGVVRYKGEDCTKRAVLKYELRDLRLPEVEVTPFEVLGVDMDGSRMAAVTSSYDVTAMVPVRGEDGGVSGFRRVLLDSDLTETEANIVARFVRKHVARFNFDAFEVVDEEPWWSWCMTNLGLNS